MGLMRNIRETVLGVRKNCVSMRGGKLIAIEAKILGVVVFFIGVLRDATILGAVAPALIVAFVFPILVSLIESLAWVAAILFSLLWGGVFGSFFDVITGGGVLMGIVAFVVSFIVHKNYSGLTFYGSTEKIDDQNCMDNYLKDGLDYEKTEVCFCHKCGRRIISSDGRCEKCD